MTLTELKNPLALAGINPAATRAPDRSSAKSLRRDFLAGYERQSGFAVEAGRGRALLAMYESVLALAMARRMAVGRRGFIPKSWLRWRFVSWGMRFGLVRRVNVVRALRDERRAAGGEGKGSHT